MGSNTSKRLFEEIQNLATEKRNPATNKIDTLPAVDILKLINNEDKQIPFIVEKEIPYIAQAVEIIVQAFNNNGRLFYIGAGTSGRLGVLDASECPPTFGVPYDMVQGIIAGGYEALVRAQEGAEDKKEKGADDLLARGFNANDVACGLAASRRTPYVIGAIEKAREIGAKTIYITCTPRSEMNVPVDVAICPVVGPEVIMGSTRMKSGTAQKLVVNMLTTTSMIRLGKVYENMMVDLQMTSKKLEERSKRTVMIITGVDYETAATTLKDADGHVKTALVMILGGVAKDRALKYLAESKGFVRNALELIKNEK
ncbi:N-acetylmuramic acid 6-phosphate etherase [candidate division KSB1 bacterium]|nr:N-acetylmuramic acid 6-phosphate etherase [candidate division KSB1 bacterium]